MTVSRRSILKGIAAAGAVASTASCVESEAPSEKSTVAAAGSNPAPANGLELPAAPNQLILNYENAIREMSNAGVDLLLCADPVNVYYLTNHQAVTAKIGMDGLTYASLSASSDSKPTYIGNEIAYYFDAPGQAVTDATDRRFYSFPTEPEVFAQLESAADIVAAPAGSGFMLKQHDQYPQSPLEASRIAEIAASTTEINASIDAALLAEILTADLPNKTIAIDNQNLRRVIEMSGLDLNIVDGERLLRRIRIQKSEAEITMMRYIAQANSMAGLAAARTVREGATFRDVRNEFWKECGQYMCNGKYLMMDSHTPTLAEGEIIEGRSFLIDCVSTFEGYHGDYGRTVCIGEPNRDMQAVIATLSDVWDKILSELRPGLKYSDLHELSGKLFAESQVDAQFAVNPHSVGLHHSDDPSTEDYMPYMKDNTELVENMVLSVDMPVLDIGHGGTAHLEDLVLIGKDGPELLNDTNNRFIVV